ncbi:MAG: BamA/TamA family outer membrane protein [Deltaproteobacteria bacterium]|jgi:outer membrane protein assembly factor BamA|nr:BamA/TamA family outer membrane protein [Deltaproteobacteria bacterium]
MYLPLVLSLFFSAPSGAVDPCESIPTSQTITLTEYQGLDLTQTWVVEQYLQHRPGTTFECSLWKKEKTAFENLDIFTTIDLTHKVEPGGIVLVYQFVELPSFVAFPAIKATDQQGWSGGGGISALSIMGTDIRLDFYIRTTLAPDPFSATEFMLYSESPTIGRLPIKWEVTAVHTNSINPLLNYKEDSFYLEASTQYQIVEQWPLKLVFIGSLFMVAHDPETNSFAPGDGTTHPIFLSEGNRDWVPKLGMGLIYDSREKYFNPHFGQYYELTIAQFGGFLGGPANYQELLGDARFYLPAFGQDVAVLSILGRYRPGTKGAYDYLHAGGANTLRTYGLRPDFYAHHEVLTTLEYRWEFFERSAFEVLGSNLYYGLQWVFGVDAVMQWRTTDGKPVFLQSLYMGPHLLFPGIDRLRVEFGINHLGHGLDGLAFGINLGLFDKSFMQRQRIR